MNVTDESSKDAKLSTFKVKINGGAEQEIKIKSGLYHLAVWAAIAMLDYPKKAEDEEFDIVEIWCDHLLPEYGPYFYACDGNRVGIYSKHSNMVIFS